MEVPPPDSPGTLPVGLLVGVASAVVLSLSVAAFLYRSSSSRAAAPINGATPRESKAAGQDVANVEATPAVRILYGTQTGTAERFSKQLAGELRKAFGDELQVQVVDLENYKPADMLHRERLVVLCVATYGDGEPTDNAADFFSWLAKAADGVDTGNAPCTLAGTSFAVFGLGNKQYEHFNAMGKKAHSALEVLGATPIVRRGDGDDDCCIDDDFDKWTAELMSALQTRPDLVGSGKVDANTVDTAPEVLAYEVAELAAGTPEDPPFPKDGDGRSHHSPYWATITAARELHTPASGRSCLHVELDIAGCAAAYEAGDHVGIHAANAEAVVEEVAGLLGLRLTQVVALGLPGGGAAAKSDLAPPPTGNLSVFSLLSWHCDLLGTPRKDALAALGAYAADPGHAARLGRLASHDGKAEYSDWVARPHRSLLEVMREFPSARPPLGVFLASVAPRLQPRLYSISSSPRQHPGAVHVTAAVVRDVMPTGRVHDGVATSWLQRQMGARMGSKVPLFLRASHFKLPVDPERPIVMVGPGTGLAPFRGFLQDRAALAAAGASLGPAALFFGCRSQASDYIYREELEAAVAGGVLSELHVAFSRDGPTKDYVQHHLAAQAARVWELLGERGGHLYVCGDAKAMAKDVHRALVSLVASSRGCTGTQAEAWVKELQDAGRYQRDVW